MNHGSCTHSDEERCLVGTWIVDEVRKAVEMGYSLVEYNPLLNLKYTNHSNVVVFADDFIIMIKAESIGEAENITNVEMKKITECAADNKIIFNEEKSSVMLMTRRKRKEQKEVAIYLNN